jgi:hypothetical protein
MTLLNNLWVTEEIRMEIKKFLGSNEMKTKLTRISGKQQRKC